MNGLPARFDRDVPLSELLRGLPRARLTAMLERTLGPAWRITDSEGALIWPQPAAAAAAAAAATIAEPAGTAPGVSAFSIPLKVDLDIVGFLVVPAHCHAQACAAADWLELLLASATRYRMAADLHLETVHADYTALQEKHAALQESETRYRILAAELEQRVTTQVGVIERARRQLYQSEKMASIGSLAAGMAHEINNPIGFIRSNLTTATLYLGTLSDALGMLHRMAPPCAETVWHDADLDFVLEDFAGLIAESVNGADRIAAIVSNLKSFSRIGCEAGGDADLNEAIRATAALMADQLPDNIAIRLDLVDLPPVAVDPGNLNQALLAILQNAALAIGPSGGTIDISSRRDDDGIRIAVRDDGCGIGADIISRIFDPFFTTRDVGQGMGLGLTIASDIVALYHGRLDVDSIEGAGSKFTIMLPSPQAPVSSGAPT
jgi:two-component system NtrC family sensor kinase